MITTELQQFEQQKRVVAGFIGTVGLLAAVAGGWFLVEACLFIANARSTEGTVVGIIIHDQRECAVIEYPVPDPEGTDRIWRLRHYAPGGDQGRNTTVHVDLRVNQQVPLLYQMDNPSNTRLGTPRENLAVPLLTLIIGLIVGMGGWAIALSARLLGKPQTSDRTPSRYGGLVLVPLGLIFIFVSITALFIGESSILAPMLLLGGFGVTGLGVAMLIRPQIEIRRRKEIRQQGQPVQAVVVELRHETFIHVNELSPWRIVAREVTEDASARQFVSHRLWVDPTDSYPVGSQLTVFVDPGQPKHYAFSLDKLDRMQAWFDQQRVKESSEPKVESPVGT